MTLTGFLPLSELVAQMGKDTRTSGWDVVVSYQVDRLNTLLQKVWDSKDNSNRSLEKFAVNHYEKLAPRPAGQLAMSRPQRGQGRAGRWRWRWKRATKNGVGKKCCPPAAGLEVDEKLASINEKHQDDECLRSTATWDVKLNKPTLRFEGTRAVLVMALTGTVATQYYNLDTGDKDGDLETRSLSDGWEMIIETALSSVTATDDGVILDTQASDPFSISHLMSKGSIMDFSSDPTHKCHIVFDCTLGDDYIVNFNYTGSKGPGEASPANNLKEAKRWVRNNLTAIDFSLASVTLTQSRYLSTGNLTPQKMVFQLFGSKAQESSSQNSSCLSVYIKTKESGEDHGVGDLSPQFVGKKGNILPIPEGYSASIIISKKLLWDRLILDQLVDIKNDRGSPAFRRIDDLSTSRDTGLELEMAWKADYLWQDASGYCYSRYESFYDYDLRDYSLFRGYCLIKDDLVQGINASRGPRMTISEDGTMVFDPRLFDMWVNYKEYPGANYPHQGGSIKCHVNAPKSKKICGGEKELGVDISLRPDEWTVQTSNPQGLTDMGVRITGLYFYLLKWPFFQVRLNVNSFATKNMLAVGSRTIELDKTTGIRVPHDFMLVGNLV
ncbi:hypothetical protein AA313_de0209603 [Arthrobotrys entomopaga]|nr:hypothetical protein AA313_de0209603 [Arthrobotrys entomopaga]